MIISRTPFRISFFGGGTDYPAWYKENTGIVLGTTINKYCYITCRYLPPFFNYKFRVRYTKREETSSIAKIKHPSVRECLKFLKFECGVEIQHNADLPARAGLGSSSAFTVGLLNALYALKERMLTKRQLALQAIHIEQNLIKENVGSQDQTLVVFGGFNKIEFGGPQEITVTPIIINSTKLLHLQKHLLLFFTGFSRTASDIAAVQVKNTLKKKAELIAMKDLAASALEVLKNNNLILDDFGGLLDQQWEIKKSMSRLISNSRIDEIYEAGRKAGASGGKLLGAGSGGFMLFFVKPEYQEAVKIRLKKLLCVPFAFENLGSQIIYYAPEQNY